MIEFKKSIESAFGIIATELRPVKTEGEIGEHFLVHDGPKQYFAKVYPDTFVGRICGERVSFFGERTWQLENLCGIASVVAPLKTRGGDFEAFHEGRPFVLFAFIEGTAFEERGKDLPEEVGKLVALVAACHLAGNNLEGAGIHDDPPDAQLEAYVLKTIQELEARDDGTLIELRDLLSAKKAKVLETLDKAKKYLEAGKWESKTVVFCHGDLNPWNVIVKPDGQLRIIDWDFACFAPRERDLFIFCIAPHFDNWLKEYEKVAGPVRISLNLLRYYVYRWELEIGTDRIQRMLHETRTEIQLQKDLGDVKDSWFQDFDEMDRKLEMTGKMLAETGRLI